MGSQIARVATFQKWKYGTHARVLVSPLTTPKDIYIDLIDQEMGDEGFEAMFFKYDAIIYVPRSKYVKKQHEERKKTCMLSQGIARQLQKGKLLACISSRPGQCGMANGYILEGEELLYQRKTGK